MRVAALAGKELRDVLRERSLVTMVLIQFFIAGFSAFLMVGLSGLYDPASVQGAAFAEVAYSGPGGFDAYLEDAGNLELVRVDAEEARQRFEDGEVGIVVEEDYDPTLAHERVITLVVPADEVQTSLIINQLKELLLQYERELREDRQERLQQEVIYADNDALARTDAIFGYTVLLPLLVLTPVFLSGAISTDAFSQEIESHTLGLLRASPMGTGTLLLGKLLVPILLVPLQAGLWMLLLQTNGFPVENVGTLLLLVTVMGVAVCGLAVLIAFHVRQAGQAQTLFALLSLALALLSLLLPRDPLNLVARLGTGVLDDVALWTLLILSAFAALVAAFTYWDVDRVLRHQVD